MKLPVFFVLVFTFTCTSYCQEQVLEVPLIKHKYGYDPKVATDAFNVLGQEICTMPVSKLEHPARISIEREDGAFLASDFSLPRLRATAFRLLALKEEDENQITPYEAYVLDHLSTRYAEDTSCGCDTRLYLLERVAEIAKKKAKDVKNVKDLVRVFCKHISRKFLKSTTVDDYIESREHLLQMASLINSLDVKTGLTGVELIESYDNATRIH